MVSKICCVKAREIIDSRGNPTLEAMVILSDGSHGIASVPSGASTGKFEAVELRDNEKRFCGKGVLKAVSNVNNIISQEIRGADADFRLVDNIMLNLDGTENKSFLGANAMLAVSLATAKACAKSFNVPLYKYLGGEFARRLPAPMMNILNGGAHASNNLDIQEFMIVPSGFDHFKDALRSGCEIYHSLKKLLSSKGLSVAIGDEGGFAPNLSSEEEAIELIISAIKKAGYSTDEVKISLDIASSEWVNGDRYFLSKAQKSYSYDELISKWERLCSQYPILSIEDPLGEEDYPAWQKITSSLGSSSLLVGDDLFVTNEKRLQYGIKNKIANAILIKPNQIGTLSETLNVIKLAKEHGYYTIISHRSGETDDSSIADIGVGCGTEFIKTGAPCRGERVSKYNRLLKIESEF
ncbi:MAG: phosphopyruvate hydratase [Clostridia bacterium]|nr:phosphopyruvate hydratase [Clostridia bacterium]MBR2296542.1 phosphopyruvate hydratase [Clostridia bacterium]